MELEEYVEAGHERIRAMESMVEAAIWKWYLEWVDVMLGVCIVLALLATVRLVLNGSMHLWRKYTYAKRIGRDNKRLY